MQSYRKAIDSSPFQQWLEYMKGPSGILTLGGSGGARCSLNKILIQVWNYINKLDSGVQCEFLKRCGLSAWDCWSVRVFKGLKDIYRFTLAPRIGRFKKRIVCKICLWWRRFWSLWDSIVIKFLMSFVAFGAECWYVWAACWLCEVQSRSCGWFIRCQSTAFFGSLTLKIYIVHQLICLICFRPLDHYLHSCLKAQSLLLPKVH